MRGRLIAGVQQKGQRGDLALALSRPACCIRRWRRRQSSRPRGPACHHVRVPHVSRTESGQSVRPPLARPGLRCPVVIATVNRLRLAVAAVSAICGIRPMRAPLSTARDADADARGRWTLATASPASHSLEGDRARSLPSLCDMGTVRIQAMLDDNYTAYAHNQRRGVPRRGPLLKGIVYCGRCGHKMAVQYKGESVSV